jgi:serine phosphatase RsbU (regulator of sigma subunit)
MDATPAERASAPPEERSPFERYHDALLHQWCATAIVLGASLVPVFVVLDWFTLPAATFERFVRYRAFTTLLLVVQLAILRLTRPSRLTFLHGHVLTLLVGGVITWMTVELGGFDSSYYAGLNLVIATNLFLPWSPAHATANALSTVLLYVAVNALFGGPFHTAALVNNLYFLTGTVVMCIATAAVRFKLVKDEYSARTELIATNRRLERSRGELKAARDALWGEMEVAKRIQTSLLPEDRRVGAYQVAARMVPAAEVGGDYYDIVDAGEGRHWVAIGDVSGHGVESGLVMMMTQTSILSLVRENPALGPAQVFSEVNGVLTENISRLRASRYMTLNVVRLEEAGLTLAGKHQDVLVWRHATRRVETVVNDGCWIGIVADTRQHARDLFVPLDEGDVALFYTDGATESMNAEGEMYGEERLVNAFARVADRPLELLLDALFADIGAFRAEQDDDVTLLVVRKASAAEQAAATASGAA